MDIMNKMVISKWTYSIDNYEEHMDLVAYVASLGVSNLANICYKAFEYNGIFIFKPSGVQETPSRISEFDDKFIIVMGDGRIVYARNDRGNFSGRIRYADTIYLSKVESCDDDNCRLPYIIPGAAMEFHQLQYCESSANIYDVICAFNGDQSIHSLGYSHGYQAIKYIITPKMIVTFSPVK